MTRRLDKTLADYVAIAISPVLIMTLVGSLVYFLLEVFYQGRYGERLHFIFGLFVMATVLIGRIAIEEGKERAQMFAAPLAVVTFLALQKFVVFHGGLLGSVSWAANLFLIGLIWWCAHKLTWDCTLIDETEDASGEGLMQTIGLDEKAAGAPPPEREKIKSPAKAPSPPTPLPASGARGAGSEIGPEEPEGVTARDAKELSWWERLVERQRRPHAPGLWVVYFSLAALPLFGVGHLFIPRGDAASRRYAFFLLFVYVASGLGLLLSTSFLGLRRYLRQRRLEMPTAMAGVWIGIGCALIVSLLFLTALLPRPGAELDIAGLPFSVGSPTRQSSRHAVTGGEAADEDKGGPRSGTREDEEAPRPESEADERGSRGGSETQKGESGSESEAEDGGSQSGSETKQRGSDSRSQKNEESSSGSDSEGEQKGGHADSEGRDEGSQPESGEDQEGPPFESREDRARSGAEQSEQQRENGAGSSSGRRGQPERGQEQREKPEGTESQTAQDDRPAGAPRERPSFDPLAVLQAAGSWVGTLFKWLFCGVLICVIGYWVWRSRAEVLGSLRRFLEGWREFWRRLFGRKGGVAEQASDAEEGPEKKLTRPFSAFADPFAAGIAGRYSPDELVRYSFDALEAWAREHGWARGPEETPHEFAQKLGSRDPSLAQAVRRLADLYCRVAYAPGTLPERSIAPLQQLWRQLRDGRQDSVGLHSGGWQ